MSFHATISFCEVKDRTDAFNKALNIIRFYQTNEGKKKLVEEIIEYLKCCNKDILKNEYFIEKIIYEISRCKFIYFKKQNLLGYVGEFKDTFPVTIHFQNQVDQNYDYSCWSGIRFFEDVVTKCKNTSIDELLDVFKDWGCDREELESNSEYYKKTLVYKTISKELDIEEWVYRDVNNIYSNEYYESFTLSPIESSYNLFDIKTMVKQGLLKKEE